MTHPDHPQRIMPPDPPGRLLKRLYGIRRVRKIVEGTDEAYLAQVRQLPCLKCGMEPCLEAAHVRITSAAFHKFNAGGKTPADKWALPLDHGCHVADRDALHRIGEFLFWHQLGLNPLLICEGLYAKRGDLVAMRAVILVAIAERGNGR